MDYEGVNCRQRQQQLVEGAPPLLMQPGQQSPVRTPHQLHRDPRLSHVVSQGGVEVQGPHWASHAQASWLVEDVQDRMHWRPPHPRQWRHWQRCQSVPGLIRFLRHDSRSQEICAVTLFCCQRMPRSERQEMYFKNVLGTQDSHDNGSPSSSPHSGCPFICTSTSEPVTKMSAGFLGCCSPSSAAPMLSASSMCLNLPCQHALAEGPKMQPEHNYRAQGCTVALTVVIEHQGRGLNHHHLLDPHMHAKACL